jgi:hypothetical protein
MPVRTCPPYDLLTGRRTIDSQETNLMGFDYINICNG